MKLSHVFAAASLAVAALGISTSAQAQRWDDGPRRGYDRGYDGRGDRGWHDRRGYDRGGYDRGGWGGGRGGWRGDYRRAHCWTEFRYRHPVRVCR